MAVALVLLVSVGADPALAITTGRGYQWINGKSGLCIGISADYSAKGVPIVQYGRNLHTDQGWDAFGLPIYPDSAIPSHQSCNTANTDELRRPVSAYYYGYPAG